MPIQIAVVYHSGYGHTAKVAEGAKADATVHVLKADALAETDWDILDASDAIIFGAPTYMGSVSGPFKVFMDAASRKWMDQKWKNKIAAGFTNSASYSGDKQSSLIQLFTLAMQHGMIWVGQSEMPPSFTGDDMPTNDKINRLGSFSGLMTQSNHTAPPDTAPGAGDLKTAKIFGARIAATAKKFKA